MINCCLTSSLKIETQLLKDYNILMTKVTLLSLDDRIVIGILGKHSLEFFEIVKKSQNIIAKCGFSKGNLIRYTIRVTIVHFQCLTLLSCFCFHMHSMVDQSILIGTGPRVLN
jgi:hypothetical protein